MGGGDTDVLEATAELNRHVQVCRLFVCVCVGGGGGMQITLAEDSSCVSL
jgi:hypothetical protein